MRKNENNAKTLKWIYDRCKRYVPCVALLSLIAIFTSLCSVWLALISKRVLDIATGAESGSMRFYSVQLFVVIAFEVLLSAGTSFLNTYTNAKMTISLRNYLFSTICKKKYSAICSYHSGDLLNRFTSDIDVVVNSAVSIVPSVVSMVTKIVAGVGALLVMNPKLAMIVLVLGFTVPAIGRTINKRYKYMHKECQRTEGRSRSFLQECFENIVVIKTFVSEIPFIKKLDQYMDENFRLKIKRTGISLIAHIALYTFFTFGYYAVLVWGAGNIAKGLITYGTLMAFLQLVSQLRAPLQNVSGIMPQYYSAIASAERLVELEEQPDETALLDREKMLAFRQNFRSLEINHVYFRYDGEDILQDCTFHVQSGRITAITGESGSGKSTLFKLILGLYEPQSGNVTVNGDMMLDTSLRGLFAYVPQGNMVLSGTVWDNITLYDSSISEEQIIEATKAAEIYDYILSTPDGFQTVLSERGAGLSEGQIQRISIARALLTDAPVLLLDEATSALDEDTETRVLSNIKKMTGKTVLFITHRNTSLKICDSIVHVENKKFCVIK